MNNYRRGSGDWDYVTLVLIFLIFIGVMYYTSQTTTTHAIDGCYAKGGTPVMHGEDFQSCEFKK